MNQKWYQKSDLAKKMARNLCALTLSIEIAKTKVYATAVSDSKLATGTTQLIQDLTTWLMVLAPILAGMMIIYYCIRRSAADEMEQKQWTNRITAAIVSCIGAILGSATLQMIVTYYSA